MNFIEIQTWPEIPQIAFFSSLFSRSFRLPEFDIEDLEEALLLDSSENNTVVDSSSLGLASPRLIPELIVSLLKGCDLEAKSWSNITTSNYQMFLRRVFRHKCEEHNIENPFNTDVDFHSLPLRTKVIILNYLCEFRLDSVDVDVITSRLEADSLRIQPLGYDSNDSIYWYFFGTRLYREDISKSSKAYNSEHVWQVICFTEDDWHNLANKFKSSKSRKEQNLYKCLAEDFLPSIPYLFKAKEAERRRRLFQRRSSQRVKSLLEQQKFNKIEEDDDAQSSSSEGSKLTQISYVEKFLKNKKREQENREKVREKVQQDRAIRAQRRRSYESTSSGKSTSNDHNELDCEELSSLLTASNQNNSRSNKENIFTRLNYSHNVFTYTTTDKDESFANNNNNNNKMPPVTTKLPGRQTNNSLSSMTGNIMIEATTSSTGTQNTVTTQIATPSPVPTSSRKKKAKAESYLETDEVLQIGMHKVLQYVKNHDDAWPFMDPVEEEIAPRYYSIIKRPMDLLKMEDKLDNGEYLTYTDFRTDFKLIVNNCRLYNGQNNEYTQMVNNLQIAFDRATKKYFDQSSSDEEQVLLEYPPVADTPNKTKRKLQTTPDESSSKHEDVKHSKYSKKENNAASASEKKSAEKVNKKQNKTTVNKVESSTKNNKRKKDKSKKVIENDIDDNHSEKEVKISKKKIKNNNLPVKEVKTSKKYSKKKLKVKEKDKIENNKKLPKLINNKKVKNSKKMNKKSTAVETVENIDAFKDEDYTDYSSDESIRDLINESFTKPTSNKKEKTSKKEKSPKKSSIEKTSKQIKKNKHKSSKLSLGCLDDDFNMLLSSRDKEKSPTLLSMDSNDASSFSDLNKSGNLFEIKDKFDLIKERRNQEKNLLKEKNNISKTSKKNKSVESSIMNNNNNKEKFSSNVKDKSSSKDKSSDKEKYSINEDMDSSSYKDNVRDKSTNVKEKSANNVKEKSTSNVKDKTIKEKSTANHKEKSIKEKPTTNYKDKPIKDKEKPPKDPKKSNNKKVVKDLFDALLEDKNNDIIINNKKSNQNNEDKLFASQDMTGSDSSSKKKATKQKATLDVLDLETEQTLKDINKWLEHTPRFEYNSGSNSPSRYTIEDMDVHLKGDNNDFRKPIPLMPSASPPSTSKKLATPTTSFQGVQKIGNDLCDPGKEKDAAAAQKKLAKLAKKKLMGDKHQLMMYKKRDIQRTTNRLQPGKTKGNLLSNLQNIIKPDEFIPLGNKEKIKETKNALITETDENSPKLNLGKVLDADAFNFSNKEESSELKNSDDDNEGSEKEQISKKDAPDDEPETLCKTEAESSNTNVNVSAVSTTTASSSETSAKPNLSAWFKAFGVSKKPSTADSSESSIKKNESNVITPQRRLSTGSSVSEISSVESSPHICMEDRSAPYPSPIGASPISALSPKIDDLQKTANYPDGNGPMRVGFYQDTTSTKSSPEKTGSPQEPLSSPYQQYPQQSNVYSSQYSNFYNPESTSNKQQHHSSSNSSPLYYDQYKSHFSQDSNIHKPMDPSVSPGSSHHSQQSSPYQQQPNSPYPPTPDNNMSSSEIHTTNSSSSSNNINNNNNNNNMSIQSPNSTYSQSNSPYHQHPASPYQSIPANQNFSNNNNNNSQNTGGNIFEQQQPEVSQFSPNPQQQASQKAIGSSSNFAEIRHPASMQQQQQQQQSFPLSSKSNEVQHFSLPTKSNEVPPVPQQPLYNPEESSFMAKKSLNPPETLFPGSTDTQYQDDVRRQAVAAKACSDDRQDNSKYMDLSKQSNRFPNQYHASSFSQPLDLDFNKNRGYDGTAAGAGRNLLDGNSGPRNMLEATTGPRNVHDGTARNLQKPTDYPLALNNCQLPDDSATNPQKLDIPKETLKTTPSISNFIQNPAAGIGGNDLMVNPRTPGQSTPIDMNYKQPNLLNSSPASSMMELTSFLRDFRQAEERFSRMSSRPTNYYDKANPAAAHMFSSKNVAQVSSSGTNFQQIYSNPMTTIAYGREQQDFSSYQSPLNIFQASNNTNQMMNVNQQSVASAVVDAKTTKKQKKKKTAAAEVVTPHQLPATNQQQAHQQYVHQQQFQSFPGIKVPSGTTSSESLKSVVPGSAFNYGPPTIPGLYGENTAYLDEFRGSQNPYYSQALRSAETIDKSVPNQPPQAHPTTPSYHHLLPSHHPSRSYPFMNSLDPAALQQQYRMMFNQSYQAGYHLGMHQQPPPHWHM